MAREFPMGAYREGFVQRFDNPALLDLVEQVHRLTLMPVETESRLASLGYATCVGMFHERIEKEALRPHWPLSLAMAWISARFLPKAIESCCLYKGWGSFQFLSDPRLAEARDDLIEACRQGRVSAWGLSSPMAPHSNIKVLELESLTLERQGARDWLVRRDGSIAYFDVIIDAAELRKIWPEISPAQAKRRRTIAAETEALKKLIEMMKKNPEQPVSKAKLLSQLNISERALDRIFKDAVAEAKAPAWSKAGRRPKRNQDPA